MLEFFRAGPVTSIVPWEYRCWKRPSVWIELREIFTRKGNPHYMLDPVRAKIAAQNIAAGLSRNFPQNQQAFDKNLKAYLTELDNWIARWEKMASASAWGQICGIPSAMDIFCKSIRYEGDRQH